LQVVTSIMPPTTVAPFWILGAAVSPYAISVRPGAFVEQIHAGVFQELNDHLQLNLSIPAQYTAANAATGARSFTRAAVGKPGRAANDP
jgi:hypothetical protein